MASESEIKGLVIERLNSIWPPAMPPDMVLEYLRALHDTPAPALKAAVDDLARNHAGEWRPKPALIRQTARHHMPASLPAGRPVYALDRAKSMLAGLEDRVRDHPLLREFSGSRVRFDAEMCLRERARIQAEALHRPKGRVGYDAVRAFGYGTWGSRSPGDVEPEANRFIAEARERGTVELGLPASALAWLRARVEKDVAA